MPYDPTDDMDGPLIVFGILVVCILVFVVVVIAS